MDCNNKLSRETFRTSRLLDFLSEKELVAQIGHARSAWPLVLVKELVDNALDACEEASVAPEISITVDETGLSVADNGPGIPPDVVADVLDFAVRVSSREAYVSPCRGAQGNALKTVVAMPFVMNGEQGKVTVHARGVRHEITIGVDRIRQQPAIDHQQHEDGLVTNGTSVTVHLACSLFDSDPPDLQNEDEDDDDLACSLGPDTKSRFLQIADDFGYVNPHLTLTCDWHGERLLKVKATDPGWKKWGPSDPTSPHWYAVEHFQRLVSAHLAHSDSKTVRELVSEFRGMTSTAKQKRVLAATDLQREPLSALVNADGKNLDADRMSTLLEAMKAESKPVKPAGLGIIGKEHVAAKFKALGCEMDSFQYRKVLDTTDGIPWICETAFAMYRDEKLKRRIITGANWSPGIVNPFRELGKCGESLDTLLAQQRASRDEPIVLLLHLVCPRIQLPIGESPSWYWSSHGCQRNHRRGQQRHGQMGQTAQGGRA